MARRFHFKVDPAEAVRRDLKDWGDVFTNFDLSGASPEDRELLASALFEDGGSVTISTFGAMDGAVINFRKVITAKGPTLEDVLDVLRESRGLAEKKAEEQRREKQARKDREDKLLAEAEAYDAESLRTLRTRYRDGRNSLDAAFLGEVNNRCHELVTRNSPEWKAVEQQLKDELDARRAAREAASKKAEADRLNLAEAKRKKAVEERTYWAQRHGSAHLRACLAEGFDCQDTYVAERLALEFPGWVREQATDWTFEKPTDPPPAALEWLANVRRSVDDQTNAGGHPPGLLCWKNETGSGYCALFRPISWSDVGQLVVGFPGDGS